MLKIKLLRLFKKGATVLIITTLVIGFSFCVSTSSFAAKGLIAAAQSLWRFNIPHYPGLKKLTEREMNQNNTSFKIITYSADISRSIFSIADYYKNVLSSRGWKINLEHIDSEFSILQFVDDELRIIAIQIFKKSTIFPDIGSKSGRFANVEDGVMVTMAIYDSVKGWFIRELTETHDMPGKDMEGLKRYPGSYRRQYVNDKSIGFETVEYVLYDQSCLECVDNFFKEQLDDPKWDLLYEDHQYKDQIEDRSEKDHEKALETYQRQKEDNNSYSAGVIIEQLKKAKEIKVLPSEATTRSYSNKKREVCNIAVTYFEGRPRTEIEQHMEEQIKVASQMDPQQQTLQQALSSEELKDMLLQSNSQLTPEQIDMQVNLMENQPNLFTPSMIANGQIRPLFFMQNQHKEHMVIRITYRTRKRKSSLGRAIKGWFN